MKPKRAVIREELVAITEDFISALILNQFLYWSERVQDHDRFLAEEKARDINAEVELRRGWIYKTADELLDELMLTGISRRTLARRLDGLVEAGFLMRRNNPKHGWDRTYQYRADLFKIENELLVRGYTLATVSPALFHSVFEVEDDSPIGHSDQSIGHHDQSSGHHDQSSGHHDQSSGHSDQSSGHSDQAIPEITSETTQETKSRELVVGKADDASASSFSGKSAVQIFEELTGEKLTGAEMQMVLDLVHDEAFWIEIIKAIQEQDIPNVELVDYLSLYDTALKVHAESGPKNSKV